MTLPGLASQFTADCVDSLTYRVSSFSPKSAAIRQRPRASLRPGVSWQTGHRCVWSDAARRVTPRCTHRIIDNLVLEPYRRTIISVIVLILQHSGGCNVARGDGYELPAWAKESCSRTSRTPVPLLLLARAGSRPKNGAGNRCPIWGYGDIQAARICPEDPEFAAER